MKITIHNVWKTKNMEGENGDLKELKLLSDINLEFCGSCIQAILGPSGSGKTTLLRLINNLDSPDKGSILLDDTPIDSIPPRQLRKDVGMVFQVPALFRGSILNNISYGPALNKKEFNSEKAKRLLNIVGLSDIDPSREIDSLSVGQQQRISFARSLANEPRVLLLDEPTSALDPSAANNLLDLIKKINKEMGVSIIMVSHIMEHAKRVADFICLIVEGRIIEDGTASSFFKHPQTEIANKFIRGEL
jgi:putative ABC transport system ATP-binding protein